MPKRVVAGLKHGIRCVLVVFVDILDLEKWRGISALHLSEGRDNPCVRCARCHCSFSFAAGARLLRSIFSHVWRWWRTCW